MAENGEHDPNLLEQPERFNHLGSRFESPEADLQLSFLQAKLDDTRRQPTALDLIDVLNCEIDDISEQKTYIHGDKEPLTKAAKQLIRVRNIVLHAAAQEFDEINTQDQSEVFSYLDRQIHRWELRSHDPNSTDPLRKEAEANKAIFAHLREKIFQPKAKDEYEQYRQTGLAEVEEFANTHEFANGNLDKKMQAPPPEYEFHPSAINTVLNELHGKSEISIDDVQKFVNTAVIDMQKQREEFEEEHPGLHDAVKYATWFYNTYKHEPNIESKRIYVSQLPDKSHVGFEISIKNPPEGTKEFSFTLTGNVGDPHDLAVNAKYVDDFDAAYEDAKRAQETITKLAAKDEDFKERLSTWDAEAIEEVLSAIRIIDKQKEYIREHSNSEPDYTDSEKMDYEALDKLAAKIMEMAGLNTDEEDEVDEKERNLDED